MAALVLLGACATQYPNQSVVGQVFPCVQGESLAGDIVRFPDDVKGAPAVLLLGYKQDSQFDIDRWLIGLDMTGTQTKVFELPTIAGMAPRMFSTQIDNGMRRGIPKELWAGVVTIYADGDRLQAFTGNTNPNNARALLLDADGSIAFFHDRGFSVEALNTLRDRLQSLR